MIRFKNIEDPLIECDIEDVYYPSDDSFMLIDYFRKNINDNYFDGINLSEIKNILDLGTGTGIIAIFFQFLGSQYQKFKPRIFASDILEESIVCAKKNEVLNKLDNQITYIQSDLFKGFPIDLKSIFNIIVFNPPYLPSSEHIKEGKEKKSIDHSWDGGQKGFEILLKFLRGAKKYLSIDREHYIYFISSSRTNLDELNTKINELGYNNEILEKRHIFFEDIILNRSLCIKS